MNFQFVGMPITQIHYKFSDYNPQIHYEMGGAGIKINWRASEGN